MKNPFKKEQARSWNGETADEQRERTGGGNDAPNNPCKDGHLWGYTRTEDRTVYGKRVRVHIDDCVRGCGATRERKA